MGHPPVKSEVETPHPSLRKTFFKSTAPGHSEEVISRVETQIWDQLTDIQVSICIGQLSLLLFEKIVSKKFEDTGKEDTK